MIRKILLILTLVMPPDKDDITHAVRVSTMDECWQKAAEFVQRPMPNYEGAIGLEAGCAIILDSDSE